MVNIMVTIKMATVELRDGSRFVNTTVLIPEELHRIARERGISFTALLRQALEDELESQPQADDASGVDRS